MVRWIISAAIVFLIFCVYSWECKANNKRSEYYKEVDVFITQLTDIPKGDWVIRKRYYPIAGLYVDRPTLVLSRDHRRIQNKYNAAIEVSINEFGDILINGRPITVTGSQRKKIQKIYLGIQKHWSSTMERLREASHAILRMYSGR